MFCRKCGAHLEVTDKRCSNCEASQEGAKFCQKCGEAMPNSATMCGNCHTQASVPASPLQWLSLGLSLIGIIFFGALGGDYYLNEVNMFDYLTIPVSLTALITAIVYIRGNSGGRMALKVISIILAAFLLIGSIGWVAM